METNEGLIIVCALVIYYILGAIINGLMHRFDSEWFSNDSERVVITVMAWIVVVPIYFFILFCDRCIYWFEKKE